jgi:hypothetical protein
MVFSKSHLLFEKTLKETSYQCVIGLIQNCMAWLCFHSYRMYIVHNIVTGRWHAFDYCIHKVNYATKFR